MRAVIMAGGKGIRLLPYTQVLPKPMLPLGDRPILAWLIEALAAAGVTDLSLAIRHMGYVFQSYFGDGQALGVQIRYVTEEEPLGTAGPLRQIPDLDEPFLVTNADIVTGLDFADLIRFHRERQPIMTVAAQERLYQSGLGLLQTEGERVVGYQEKPTRWELTGLGIYLIDPRALAYLPAQGPCDMPDLIRTLLDAQEEVLHYRTDALWVDLGSPADYEDVTARWTEIAPQIKGRMA